MNWASQVFIITTLKLEPQGLEKKEKKRRRTDIDHIKGGFLYLIFYLFIILVMINNNFWGVN